MLYIYILFVYICFVYMCFTHTHTHTQTHTYTKKQKERPGKSTKPSPLWSASLLLCIAYVSIRQHTSAYVSIRQHASAYVSIRQNSSAPLWSASLLLCTFMFSEAYKYIYTHILSILSCVSWAQVWRPQNRSSPSRRRQPVILPIFFSFFLRRCQAIWMLNFYQASSTSVFVYFFSGVVNLFDLPQTTCVWCLKLLVCAALNY